MTLTDSAVSDHTKKVLGLNRPADGSLGVNGVSLCDGAMID